MPEKNPRLLLNRREAPQSNAGLLPFHRTIRADHSAHHSGMVSILPLSRLKYPCGILFRTSLSGHFRPRPKPNFLFSNRHKKLSDTLLSPNGHFVSVLRLGRGLYFAIAQGHRQTGADNSIITRLRVRIPRDGSFSCFTFGTRLPETGLSLHGSLWVLVPNTKYENKPFTRWRRQ